MARLESIMLLNLPIMLFGIVCKISLLCSFYVFPNPIMPQNSNFTMLQLLHKLQTFYMPNNILQLKHSYNFNKNAYNFTLKSITTCGILLLYHFPTEIYIVNESNKKNLLQLLFFLKMM